VVFAATGGEVNKLLNNQSGSEHGKRHVQAIQIAVAHKTVWINPTADSGTHF